MSNQKVTYSGLGTILFIVFLVLKLCNVITWSWWWVVSPLLISWGIVLIVFIASIITIIALSD